LIAHLAHYQLLGECYTGAQLVICRNTAIRLSTPETYFCAS
jgi:hypothetical protein